MLLCQQRSSSQVYDFSSSLYECESWTIKKAECQRMLKLPIALISHATKVTHKILQARLQQYVKHELPDVQAGFREGRGTRDQIANIHWIIIKQGNSRKSPMSALLTMPEPLTVWITTNCGKF